MHGIDGGPCPSFRLFFRNAALAVTFLNVFCFSFLLVGIFVLVSSRHNCTSFTSLPLVLRITYRTTADKTPDKLPNKCRWLSGMYRNRSTSARLIRTLRRTRPRRKLRDHII